MKRSFLIWLKEWLAGFSKKPWACFETTGPDASGRVAFSISWNHAFIDNLHRLGMAGADDEETVNMFFLQMKMYPEEMVDDIVNPEGTPNLTNEANNYRRG